MIHIDTSFLIRSFAPASPQDKQLRLWIQSGTRLALSTISWAEFACGPVTAPQFALIQLIFGEPLAFTRVHAELAAELFNSTGRKRGTFFDCMIAAVAVEQSASLATSNPRDFRFFQSSGLQLISPP